jgi:sensor histidine kinase YesM
LPAWILAALSIAAFGVAWLVSGKSQWLMLTTQLWLGYSLAWLTLQAISRWTKLRAWSSLLGITLLAAVLAGLLVLPLSHDFLPDRLRSWTWVLVRGLPPTIFALVFLLPGMFVNWREQQKHQRQLALVEQRRAVAELSKQVTLAELKSLQAQVEPHFLYNTLAGVQYLVRRNAVLADEMLGHLITYLRRAVPSMRAQTSTVLAECELVQAYLEVMKLRLGERLQTCVDCNPDAAAFPMPPMMLATLVENAIKHGIEPLPQGGRIDVKAEIHGAELCLTVSDTGAGLTSGSGASNQTGSGTGLANTTDRLRALFGDAASLSVESGVQGGVVATLRIALAALQAPVQRENA